MTPVRDDRSGRFKFDDKPRKWLVRYFVTVGLLVHAFVVAVIVGIVHLVS